MVKFGNADLSASPTKIWRIRERQQPRGVPCPRVFACRAILLLRSLRHSLSICGLCFGLSIPISLEAATFTVTKTADTADGVCDADCSLREAIVAANALTGADTIAVPAGVYTLTIAG